MIIRIEYRKGYYYGYYYDQEITRQSTLLKASEKVYRYIKGRGDLL